VKILNILRSISGQFEITRVLGALGVLVYIVATHVFVGWTVFHQGKAFDVVAYCAAFPTGLAVAIGIIATAAGIKDQKIAAARVTQDTGALPAQPVVKP
jgi:ATP/ADP translocase